MAGFAFTLDAEERAYLEELMDADLRETRVEVRRTLEPALRDDLRRREEMIQRLLTKLRGTQAPAAAPS